MIMGEWKRHTGRSLNSLQKYSLQANPYLCTVTELAASGRTASAVKWKVTMPHGATSTLIAGGKTWSVDDAKKRVEKTLQEEWERKQ